MIKSYKNKLLCACAALLFVAAAGPALAQNTNSLRVYLSPQAARDAGAQWRVVSAWRNSAEIEYGLPSGQTEIQFRDIIGWVRPDPITFDLPASMTTFTTNALPYTRAFGNIIVENLTPGGEWYFSGYPTDFTDYMTLDRLRGTADTNIVDVPAGNYTIRFEQLDGFNLPAANNTTQTAQGANPARFDGTYLPGLSLRVQVYTPADLPHLPGTGYGRYEVTPTNAYVFIDGIYYFASNANITVTAFGTNITIGADDYESFFFEWNGTGISTPYGPTEPGMLSQQHNNPIYITMNRNRVLTLLFSREYHWYDDVGDIDADRLPDEWEIVAAGGSYIGWVTNYVGPNNGDYGTFGNSDGDMIPAVSTNSPVVYSIDAGTRDYQVGTNTFSYGYGYERINSFNGAAPAYPLPPARMARGGYAVEGANASPDAVAFMNLYECRGLDGFYRGRSPGGIIGDDDPYTSPTNPDTDTDGFGDGWEYYFWRWRSADAYNRGLLDSCNLDWVEFNPIFWNNSARDTDECSDVFDTDGLTDTQEYTSGTDPTHCDTDGDFMDDKWEIDEAGVSQLNPLVYNDQEYNDDLDYMAMLDGESAIVTGQTGVAFSDPVYEGNSNVWVDVDGNGAYTIYHDWVLLNQAPLSNGVVGTLITDPVLFGYTNDLTAYQRGDEVWVDENANGAFDLGERVIVDKPIKHELVYMFPIAVPWPGHTQFNPNTAWQLAGADTIPYNNLQEYLAADNYGRIPWNPGGQRITALVNEDPNVPARTDATSPNSWDTDSDQTIDGWELYVGMNPNWISDAAADSDGDGLNNVLEWANTVHSLGQGNLGTGTNMWNKPLPTDPGVLTAPYPNDPHPMDTDWDGLPDGGEQGANSNPSTWDTDGDYMPDGWEIYAGTDPMAGDATADLDGDGLLNWQEYWTGAIPEWNNCRHDWLIRMDSRLRMQWDPAGGTMFPTFIPPDFVTCGSFLLINRVLDTEAAIRLGAANSMGHEEYHTALAGPNAAIMTGSTNSVPIHIDPWDSDDDGLDDYWEVYHGLNPLMGTFNLMEPMTTPPPTALPWRYGLAPSYSPVAVYDAMPSQSGYQVGPLNAPFNSLNEMYAYVTAFGQWASYSTIVGPHNFGRMLMDPDGDGLPNIDEYPYNAQRATYHTDPSPLFRTDPLAPGNVTFSYYDPIISQYYCPFVYPSPGPYFPYEMVEGFDSDNDGVGDFFEVNSAADIIKGSDPLDARNPLRNRAVYLRGKEDYLRTLMSGTIAGDAGFLTRFTVEAWVCPDNPVSGNEQFVLDRSSFYPNPYDQNAPFIRSNFRLGVDPDGRPFVRYNGQGGGTLYNAVAQMGHRLPSNTWSHIAGVYDGKWLRVYVNGIESKAIYTTELPANGGNTMMVGAPDPIPGVSWGAPQWFRQDAQPTNGFFKGYLDEVRVWNGVRSVSDIVADKDRRFGREEVANLAWRAGLGTNAAAAGLYSYYTFDDVPDPAIEGVVPAALAHLDTNLHLHPTITWWSNTVTRSRVYIGHTNAPYTPYNYLVYAEDHVAHIARVPPGDDFMRVTTTNGVDTLPADYRNPASPYHEAYTLGDPYIRDLLFHNYAKSEAVYPSWLPSVDSTPDGSDSDGDGLPDWWEIMHGLDPYDPYGDNGAWGDNDNDGLNNLAEFQAGTDPNNWDTDGDGIGDYDSSDGPGSRTYGELYTDGDMMPDTWEIAYGLDPNRYDAHEDPDGDGWSNFAEYQAGTHPNNARSFPRPYVNISAKYAGMYMPEGSDLVLHGYQQVGMDGTPQAIYSDVYQYDNQLFLFQDIVTVNQNLAYYDYNNWTMTPWGVIQIPNPPIIPGTLTLRAGPYTFTDTSSQEGQNVALVCNVDDGSAGTITHQTGEWHLSLRGIRGVYTVSVSYQYYRDVGQQAGNALREGDMYLFGFLDLNANAAWNLNEPCSVALGQPFYLGWKGLDNLEITMSDEARGSRRFEWPDPGTTNAINVSIYQISTAGWPAAPINISRDMQYPRQFFHEWDFLLAGYFGLPIGSYQWRVGANTGYFSVNYPTVQVTPGLLYPLGSQLVYGRIGQKIKWTMDDSAPAYRLQVLTAAGALAYDSYRWAPNKNKEGEYIDYMPPEIAGWLPGVYFWRIAGWTPRGDSTWSDWQTFELVSDRQTYSKGILGDIYYFGKVRDANIVIEAFTSPCFSGTPVARTTLAMPNTSEPRKTSFEIWGLDAKEYYLRAYIDTRPAGAAAASGRLDFWKSYGFVMSPLSADFRPISVDLRNTTQVDGQRITIRDRDTDNDQLPDAWEMMFFGSLAQTGDMDYDGDGLTNLEEYAIDFLDTDPTRWDTDGDALSDYYELLYDGDKHYDPYNPVSNPRGTGLNATNRDTDGDRFSDWRELAIYGTDPLDPNSYPRGISPYAASAGSDFNGDGRSELAVYNQASGLWYILDSQGTWVWFGIPWGGPGLVPVPGDYNGDGRADLAVYAPSTGLWYITDALGEWNWFGIYWGGPGMMPVPGDYNGDGRSDLAVYAPSTGQWYITDPLGEWNWFGILWGGPGMAPVPGDYNGDSRSELAVYSEASGYWFITDAQGAWNYFGILWGGPGLKPVWGDYNGDGRADLAVYSEAAGLWYITDAQGAWNYFGIYWGGPGLVPVSGDFDGDGCSDLAVYAPATGHWYITDPQGRWKQFGICWGGPGMSPVGAAW